MYEPLDAVFAESAASANRGDTAANDCEMQALQQSEMCNNQDREQFVDALLSEYLGAEKMREKDSLRDKIKYKHQQIESTSKHIRQERKEKARKAAGAVSKSSAKYSKKLHLTCKQKRMLGLYKLNRKEKLDYSKYESINRLWRSYATSCLITCLPQNNPVPVSFQLSEESVLNCLKQMDYHGCCLTVTRSNVKSQVGMSGIVLQDKKNVFFVVDRKGDVKILKKSGSLFELELLDCKFTLVGANMCYRPEMRTTKHAKIKVKTNIK